MDNNDEAQPFKPASAFAAGGESLLALHDAGTDDFAAIGYEAAHPALQAHLWCEASSAVPDGRDWQ